MEAGRAKLYEADYQQAHEHLFEMAAGQDIRGMEIAQAIRIVSKLINLAIAHSLEAHDLSSPRLGILLILYMEEEKGNTAGINPTRLSHFQHVKKNTITSLLKGLEESGLVERAQHPVDRRTTLIRITPAGRALVRSDAPLRFKFMDQLTSGLTSDERDQLIILLNKLRTSLIPYTRPEISQER